MKRITMFCGSTNLIAAVLLLGAATAQGLKAEFECEQELLAGPWVYHAEHFILEREGMDIFPSPGPFSDVGILVLDEQGKASVARQTNSAATGTARPNFIPTFDVQLTINSDCTGRFLFSLGDLPPEHPLISVFGLQSGQVVFDLDLVCANGQLECWSTYTEPAGVFTGIVRMKRVEAFSAELETKMDALSAKIDLIMRTLGIRPTP